MAAYWEYRDIRANQIHFRDEFGVSGIVNVVKVHRNDEPQATRFFRIAHAVYGIGRERFYADLVDSDALPGTDHFALRNMRLNCLIAEDNGILTAQLFNIGNGAEIVVVMADEYDIGVECAANDTPGVDVNQWGTFNQETAITKPLNFIDPFNLKLTQVGFCNAV